MGKVKATSQHPCTMYARALVHTTQCNMHLFIIIIFISVIAIWWDSLGSYKWKRKSRFANGFLSGVRCSVSTVINAQWNTVQRLRSVFVNFVENSQKNMNIRKLFSYSIFSRSISFFWRSIFFSLFSIFYLPFRCQCCNICMEASCSPQIVVMRWFYCWKFNNR